MADAGPGPGGSSRAQRRSARVVTVLAVLLVLGGGIALATGLLKQDPSPPIPSRGAGATGSLPSKPDTNDIPAPSSSATVRTNQDLDLRPVRIRIPALEVASSVTTVGLRRNGTLEVPQPGPDYDKAAWFDRSPAPGQVGPAVIEGHVDGKAHGPSVFYRLGAIKPGNQIAITRRNSSVIRFVVYAVRLYPKKAFPTLKVYGNTRGPELRLITCGGTFDSNRAAGGYTSNVVVFARRA